MRMARGTLPVTASTLALLGILSFCAGEGHTHTPHGGKGVRSHHNGTQAIEAGDERAAKSPRGKIPHILHYVHLSGYEAWSTLAKEEGGMKKQFYDGCVAAHRGWEIRFWNTVDAERLLRDHYDWFLPVWHAYRVEIERANAIRSFIMHHYGGVYMDLDVECFSSADKYVEQYDLVLQGIGPHGVINSAMASVPGHPFFETVWKVLQERYKWNVPPLVTTGMGMLVAATSRYFHLREGDNLWYFTMGYGNQAYEVDGYLCKIAAVGEFVEPCFGDDGVCKQHFERGLELGTYDLSKLIGRHHYANTWLRQAVEAQQAAAVRHRTDAQPASPTPLPP